MEFPKLETDRLSLIQVKEEHAKSYFEIMSKDKVTKYYGMDSLESMDDAVKIIDSFQTIYESKRGVRWGIILKETNDFIGTVGLNNLSALGKRAEIGYELHPSYWNRGCNLSRKYSIKPFAKSFRF